MRKIKVNLGRRSYSIIVGHKVLASLGNYLKNMKLGPDAYIITNNPLKNKYGKILDKALKNRGFTTRFQLVGDTEKSKSIKTAFSLIKDIASYDTKKKIIIIAFGGGVIGDLAGFVASIYKRGIPCIQTPTTLLAQVDSSIGGKTAVDLEHGKNLVGAFYQPRLVLSDTSLLKTLAPRQVRAGLAEIIKYGIIKDKNLFIFLEKNLRNILNLKPSALDFIIQRSSSIKARIVQKDELEEKGIRTVLNFGHTLGHAIEAAGGFRRYNHGEAIALGMLLANDIGKNLGLGDCKTRQRIENLIIKAGLPNKIKGLTSGKIIKAHYRDKKFIGSRNKFVLSIGIGKTKIIENIPLEIIKEAIEKRIG